MLISDDKAVALLHIKQDRNFNFMCFLLLKILCGLHIHLKCAITYDTNLGMRKITN